MFAFPWCLEEGQSRHGWLGYWTWFPDDTGRLNSHMKSILGDLAYFMIDDNTYMHTYIHTYILSTLEIRASCESLIASSSVIVVYGHRGATKTTNK